MAVESDRPRPEALLEQAEAEERRKRRGKLRIFLGFAAGVGKTYAMLEAAHEQLTQGRDVAVAYVETHGRQETEALLTGLTLMPRRRVEYRGVTLEEMDLDAVLGRRPQLALVDELAHTNAPGSRHTKRCQDVDELLAAGIDVYTTLNIQHVESFKDVVAQITGVTVHETVPDRTLEEADEIDLVDLPPDELIQRLHEGKVYVPEQATRAVEKFFRPGNLNALREIALRYVAGRVDRQMRTYMGAHAIPGPWPAGERVLVCIDADPLGERLVRTGRRLAAGLDAEWIVLHVETAEEGALSDAAHERIARTLRLAEELGARTVTLPGTSAAEEIIRYARAQNVTKIVVGVSHHPHWVQLIHGSVVDRVIRASGAMDVYVISGPTETRRPSEAEGGRRLPSHAPYLYSAGVVGLVTIASALVRGVLAPTNLTMLYLLAVVIIALQWGRGPAVLAAALGVAAFDLFFVPPYLSLAVSDTQYLLTFAALLVVGLVIGTLASRTREQAQAARRREAYTGALYALSGELASTSGLDAIMQAIARHIVTTFSRRVAVFLPVGEELQPRFSTPGFPLDDNERAVATWVFRHGQPAGFDTDTLPAASARYLPLTTVRGIVGVLGVQPTAVHVPLSPEQRRLLDAFASQAALAIERVELAEEARRGQVLRETERLQNALLNSISHDLRTPLATITGALSSLTDDAGSMADPIRRELLENAKEEADRLNHLLGNLLDMNRLEAGALKLRVEPGDVEDLIGTALTQLGEAAQHRRIDIAVPPDLPLVPVDFVLVTQALTNLLDNAVKYSPPDAPIEIRAQQAGGKVEIRVEDRGPGIPPGDLARVFDKFYRIQRGGGAGGVGLGLSISQGIIEAHGGRIWAENRPGGGTAFVFTLPVAAAQADGQRAAAAG
jgi:two-component system sensor histidine kinase KdpD